MRICFRKPSAHRILWCWSWRRLGLTNDDAFTGSGCQSEILVYRATSVPTERTRQRFWLSCISYTIRTPPAMIRWGSGLQQVHEHEPLILGAMNALYFAIPKEQKLNFASFSGCRCTPFVRNALCSSNPPFLMLHWNRWLNDCPMFTQFSSL